jgi:phage terminase large subunit
MKKIVEVDESVLANPIAFSEVFQLRLWSLQKTILKAAETERRIAVKGAHGSGKTLTAALLALYFCARFDDARVLIVAPGWITVKSVFWTELHSLLARAKFNLPFTVVNQLEVKFGPKNMIIGLSTIDAGRLQGHHAEHLLIIVDEATALDPTFWPSIEGVQASGDSHIVMLGNPTSNSGYFYDAFGRNRALWKCFTIGAFDTPNFKNVSLERLLRMPDAELDKNPWPMLTPRRWVKERYQEWWSGNAENSPLWQARVLGQFPSSSSNALIPLSWLEAACRPAVGSVGARLIIGVDPAEAGRDKTAVVACSGGAIVDSAAFSDADARWAVIQFIRKHADNLAMVRVDSIGVGWGFTKHIRDCGYRVAGIYVSARAEDPERFMNSRAVRYWFLRERFERGEVSGLANDLLIELASLTYGLGPRGQTLIDDKASVKSILGHSPDLAEAAMLALGEPSYEPFVHQHLPIPTRGQLLDRVGYGQRGGPQADDALEDALGHRGERSSPVAQSRCARSAVAVTGGCTTRACIGAGRGDGGDVTHHRDGGVDQPRTWGDRRYFCEEPRYVKGIWRTFEYKGLNYLIQGSAADCTKEAMIRAHCSTRAANGRVQLILSVHDQLTARA